MRPVAFDGGATYTLNVLRHLPELLPEAEIVVYCRAGEERIAPAPNLVVEEVAVTSAARRAAVEVTALSRLRADVFVSPNESLPLRLPAPTVVVAQNIAYHCDRSAVRFRGGTRAERLASAMQAAYYRRRMPEAYRRAARVVAISRTAADLLARRAGLPMEKTSVSYGGSDSFLLEPRPAVGRDRSRLLVVSAVAPYKNLETTVRVLARLRRDRPDLRLDVAGPDWRGYRSVVEAAAAAVGVREQVRFHGPLEPADVASLYSTSGALLHLSECEACPLPPLEAMRSGLPVVAARRSSIPEVVADGAVVVDPEDVEGVAAAVADILSGDDAELRERGERRARELTWAQTSAGIAEAVRDAVRTRSR